MIQKYECFINYDPEKHSDKIPAICQLPIDITVGLNIAILTADNNLFEALLELCKNKKDHETHTTILFYEALPLCLDLKQYQMAKNIITVINSNAKKVLYPPYEPRDEIVNKVRARTKWNKVIDVLLLNVVSTNDPNGFELLF